MKKIILIIGILVGILIGSNVFSQTIKLTITEAQVFYKFGKFDNPQDVLNDPDVDMGVKNIDCDLIFDLQEMTSTFFSRSRNGETNKLPIIDVKQNGSKYIISTESYGRYDPSFTYSVKIYFDINKQTALYTWYDKYGDCSLVQKELKVKISLISI